MHSVSFYDPASDVESKKQSARKSDVEILFDSVDCKSDIIHILRQNKPLPRIPLPSPVVTTDQAAKDFKRERVLLNDVPFIPDQDHSSRSNGFILTLTRLIQRLQSQGACASPDVADVAACILQRACRTTTGADSFFMVQRLFCIEGTFIVQKTDKHDPPVKVDVFVVYDQDRGDDGGVDSLRSSQSSVVSKSSNRHRNDSNGGTRMRSGGSGDRNSRTSSMSSKHSARSDGGEHSHFFSSSSLSFGNFVSSSSGAGSITAITSNCSVSATSALLEDRLRQTQQQQSQTQSYLDTNQRSADGNMSFSFASSTSIQQQQHHLCARIESTNVFTLYDSEHMENMTGESSQDPLPWLELEATVVDELDFSTGEAWRSLLIECTYPPLSSTRPSFDHHDGSSSIYMASASSVMAMTSWFTGSSRGSGSSSTSSNGGHISHRGIARQISPPSTLLRHTPPLTTQQQQQQIHPQYPTRINKPPFSSSHSPSPSLPSTAAVSASASRGTLQERVRSTSGSGSDYSLTFLSGRDRSRSGSQAEQLPPPHSSSSRSRGNSNISNHEYNNYS